MTRFYTGKIAPSPKVYKYWVDTNENPYGGVIKYFNGSEWIYINDKLVEKDKELQNKITEIQNTLKTKADKAATLAGYGINDAYTKTLTDSKVTEAIGELVGTAPDALDTLYELAEALNNDEDFAATVTNQLGTKVDKTTYNADKATFATKTEVNAKLSTDTYNTDKATFATKTELGNKVDKVSGKQLSTNDFTNEYKSLLDGLADLITIPDGGTTGQVLKKTADGVAWLNDNNTTYSNATTSTAGLMSATDKLKLDNLSLQLQSTSFVSVTLTTELANGNGTITSEVFNKLSEARTNNQPILIVNDRTAFPITYVAMMTDGHNEQQQGTLDIILPARIDSEGKITQTIYQIVGSASTTLTISTVEREAVLSTETTN